MGINANVTNSQITATVGETQIDVAVSGGVGPTGSSGTIAVSAPLTNAGTTTAANLGLSVGTGLAVSGGSLVVSYGTGSTVACRGDDARLSDSREWSADTVSQAEAEAGNSTTRRAFTPQRVYQAIAAWWAASASKTKLDGIAAGATANATDAQLRDRSTHTGTQTLSTISDAGTAASRNVPATGNAGSTEVVLGADTRLTNARTPTAHSHGNLTNDGKLDPSYESFPVIIGFDGVIEPGYVDAAYVNGLGTASAKNTPASGNASATEVVLGSDTRLTNARTPTAHKSTHATGGTDALSPADIGAAALAHAHSAADVTSGTFDIARLPVGTTSTTVAAGNDARLSDTRTPTDGSVTDAKITSGGLSASSINWVAITPWAANTAYAKGDLVSNAGIAYRRSAAGTSGATFNVAMWQQITPSEFVGSQITTGTVNAARLGAHATTHNPGGSDPVTLVEVYEFTRTTKPAAATGSNGSYTFTIPAAAKAVEFFAIGAGGGGGSGRRGAAGSARFGGGGGGSGGVMLITRTVAELASRTVSIVLGAGGAGGAARTTDNTDGNNGSNGVDTAITISGRDHYASRGGGGSGGTNAAGTGGSGGTAMFSGTVGSSSSVTATPSGSNVLQNAGYSAGGGGAGGGISTGDVSYGGAIGRAQGWSIGGVNVNSSGGTAPGGSGQNAADAFTQVLGAQPGGAGAGGAAGNASTAGGNGGNGANYGGAGGGGGASFNGYNSGAGGNGGDGYVRITVWY